MSKLFPLWFRFILTIIILPFNVLITIPYIILYYSEHVQRMDPLQWKTWLGSILILVGLILFIKMLSLFFKTGKGTLASWDPPKCLIIKGPYRYVRNPMITGVLTMLVGQAFLFNSISIMIWAMLFFLINTLYFIFKEEPDLEKRFGDEYAEYRKNVPMWFPKLKQRKPQNKGR